MAVINNAFAIRYSNEYIRPLSNMFGRAYNFGRSLDEQWIALGASVATLTIHVKNFRTASELIMQTYLFRYQVNTYWLAGASAFFPNNADTVADSGDGATQDPSRPPIAGSNVNSIITRGTEFTNWIDTGLFAGGGSDAGAQRAEFTKAMFGVGLPLTAGGVTTAGTLITYIRQLRTNYEASSGANLNSILQVAVNPGAAVAIGG